MSPLQGSCLVLLCSSTGGLVHKGLADLGKKVDNQLAHAQISHAAKSTCKSIGTFKHHFRQLEQQI